MAIVGKKIYKRQLLRKYMKNKIDLFNCINETVIEELKIESFMSNLFNDECFKPIREYKKGSHLRPNWDDIVKDLK